MFTYERFFCNYTYFKINMTLYTIFCLADTAWLRWLFWNEASLETMIWFTAASATQQSQQSLRILTMLLYWLFVV